MFTGRIAVFVFAMFLGANAFADIARTSDDVYVRIVDVGGGLCSVVSVPDGYHMIYDAGHWHSSQCLSAAEEIIADADIEMMVISHSDADHHGEAAAILERFNVHRIIRTGYRRGSDTWKATNTAIANEALHGATIENLATGEIAPGTQYELGDAMVTYIAGWPRWEGGWADGIGAA